MEMNSARLTEQQAARSGSEGASRADPTVRRIPLTQILGRDREVVIEFNGADYRLRITRNSKLILTK
jgi:hemin uptake protein HemP